MKPEKYMAYGTGALSRLECKTCKETTLHKHGKCIHCETEYVATPVRSFNRWRNTPKGGTR